MNGKAGGSIRFSAPGIGAQIRAFRSHPRSRRSPQRIDDRAVDGLLSPVVLVIAHNADFDRRFLEKRLPKFAAKHWACSRADVDWKAEGIRSSALEFVAYSLDSFTMAIGLRVTVVPPSMRWHNDSPVQGGWHCRPSWNKRDDRHGGYGRRTPPWRRRKS